MDNLIAEILPDLIVSACPLGCNCDCARIWSNEATGHRIVCKCPCGHTKKPEALVQVGAGSNACYTNITIGEQS